MARGAHEALRGQYGGIYIYGGNIDTHEGTIIPRNTSTEGIYIRRDTYMKGYTRRDSYGRNIQRDLYKHERDIYTKKTYTRRDIHMEAR